MKRITCCPSVLMQYGKHPDGVSQWPGHPPVLCAPLQHALDGQGSSPGCASWGSRVKNGSIGTVHSPVCLDECVAAAQVRSFGHSPSWVTDHPSNVCCIKFLFHFQHGLCLNQIRGTEVTTGFISFARAEMEQNLKTILQSCIYFLAVRTVFKDRFWYYGSSANINRVWWERL